MSKRTYIRTHTRCISLKIATKTLKRKKKKDYHTTKPKGGFALKPKKSSFGCSELPKKRGPAAGCILELGSSSTIILNYNCMKFNPSTLVASSSQWCGRFEKRELEPPLRTLPRILNLSRHSKIWHWHLGVSLKGFPDRHILSLGDFIEPLSFAWVFLFWILS